MPQLIAMVIVVVGAMIYMFQTFGGTGDKIEGVAQKASIITEINNIKDGLKIAAKSEQIGASTSGDVVSTLHELGSLSYFADQINEQVQDNNTQSTPIPDTYYAISFGGAAGVKGGMTIKLVPKTDYIPGIYVDLSEGTLADNAAFLESQIANDLSPIAFIDRHAVSDAVGADAASGATGVNTRLPSATAATGTAAAGNESSKDGKFVIYFKDFGSDEVVK
ncbi:MAG: hypothetical protein CL624_10385 [Arcobacter sp.]|nr:hypothetical protein [Arcobacter sp.]|tara:strand:+ start:1561 stop:2223 length:663 start_codon:yes stop_codon:yes gene_type:complete